jgi:PAS domain S-box-containing protein
MQVWFFTDESTYGAVNKVYAQFNGRKKQDLEFKDVYDVFPKEISDIYCKKNREVFESKKGIEYEEWIPHESGGKRCIKVCKNPIFDDNNNVEYVICSAEDITQMKNSEQNFQTFFETIDDPMIILKPDGEILRTNPALRKKLGYSSEELRSMYIVDLYPSEYQNEIMEIFKDNRSFNSLPFQKRNDAILPVETRFWKGVFDGEDCVFGISKDISIQDSAIDKFNKLFNNNPTLMAMSDLSEGCFVEVNNTFLEKLGYEKEEIIGKSSKELQLFVESEKQKKIADILSKEGHIKNVELDVRRKDGAIITGLFSGDIIENQGEKIFLTVMTDITAQKKAKKELQEKIDVLERYKKVTVDRELKMVELKKEIKKLNKNDK